MKLTERKVEIRKAEFLAVGKACKAVFWFTQGFTEGVFGFSGERGLNFCVSGALPRGCVRGSSAWLIFLQSHTEQDCVRHTLGNDQLNGYAGPSTREWWWFLLLVSFSCVELHWVTTIDSYPKSRIFYVHILNRKHGHILSLLSQINTVHQDAPAYTCIRRQSVHTFSYLPFS